jgi:hypothetical protein
MDEIQRDSDAFPILGREGRVGRVDLDRVSSDLGGKAVDEPSDQLPRGLQDDDSGRGIRREELESEVLDQSRLSGTRPTHDCQVVPMGGRAAFSSPTDPERIWRVPSGVQRSSDGNPPRGAPA